LLVLLALLAGLGTFPSRAAAQDVSFLRGDTNSDGKLSISDVLTIRRFLFLGQWPSTCMDTMDVDDVARVDISDEVFLLNSLFLGGPAPPAPQGSLGTDPTPDAVSCASYDVTTAAPSEDIIRLGDVSGAPGDEVAVPVYLTNAVAVEAFQLLIRFDPAFVPVLGYEESLLFDSETFYSGVNGGFLNVTLVAGENVLLVGMVPNLANRELHTPPGTDRLVFKIHGKISDTAEPGTVASLEPTNGPGGAGFGPYGLLNELTHEGEARLVSTLPHLEPGLLAIVGDQTVFIRGDSNQDSAFDISDAVGTLQSLFQGAGPLRCADAADVDDSGRVDITDAIFALGHLFRGGPAPPPPFPAAGVDPTGDGLACLPATP
jgi:hypothetical protein